MGIPKQQSKGLKLPKMTIAEQTAIQFGVSVERVKQQYVANAEGLKKLWEKAEKSGKKVNGATASYWKERYEFFLAQSK